MKKISSIVLTLFLIAFKSLSIAQEAIPRFSEAIEDNSYFIEEAYNQEPGVIQHISNGVFYNSPQKDFLYTFTEEWPLFGQTHQLSATIPYTSLNSGLFSGFGDIVLNYRYQLTGHDEWVTMSPRFSIILPTGDDAIGLGLGSMGMQINFPASKRLSEKFITHVNLGTTLYPSVEGVTVSSATVDRTLTFYNAGASLIYLANPQFNVMLEGVVNFSSGIGTTGEVERSTEFILSPGFRYAIDIGNLQIVPGFAIPFSFSENDNRTGMFFYLSFEHPVMDSE